MSLIVEDGTGKIDAETYNSFADATAYFVKIGKSVVWTVDQNAGEVALRQAQEYMLGEWRTMWKGTRTYPNVQALDFPRNYLPLVDQPQYSEGYSRIDGYGGGFGNDTAYYPINAIPAEIKKAECLLALRALANGGDLAPDVDQQEKSVKIGPLAVEFNNMTSQLTTYTQPARLIAPFLKNGGQARLIRR